MRAASILCLTSVVLTGSIFAQTQEEFARRQLTSVNSQAPLPPGSVTNPPTQMDLAYFAWQLFFWAAQGTPATLSNGTGRETATASFVTTGQSPLYNGGNNPLIFEALYHRTESYP